MKRSFKKIMLLTFVVGCCSFVSAQNASNDAEQLQKQLDQVKGSVQDRAKQLDQTAYYSDLVAQTEKKGNTTKQLDELKALNAKMLKALQLKSELEWVNLDNIKTAMQAMAKKPGYDKAKSEALYTKLNSLVSQGFVGVDKGDDAAVKRAEEALLVKRQLLLSSPDVDVDNVLTVKIGLGDNASRVGAGSLGVQPNNWSNLMSAWGSKNGCDAEMMMMSNLKSGNPTFTSVYKPGVKGAGITDLKLNWDGKRVMFTTADENRKWQVHEVNVDGSDFKRLTNIPEADLEFFDGTYLPDGNIMAVSNIGYQGVPCVNGSDAVGNMVLYNPKSGALRRLTFDQESNWHPTVMHNGRVMYVRWEYTDLTHYFSRIVFHMNPDGTEQKALYGSGSLFPNSTFDVQPLPDNNIQFVGVISGHHGIARSGRLIIFDPAKSRKEEKGMVQELPFSKRPIIPIVKDEMVNGVWPQFIKPYPLSNETYLVTAKLSPNSLWGIYLVDIYDNLTLVANIDQNGLIYSIPVKSTKTPPVIPSKVNEDKKDATVFIQDLYEGEGLRGVPRGEVKALRLYAFEYAYRNTLSDHYAHGIQAGWDLKRLLGVVPVEEDGSATFTIPANTPISIQPLDKDGRAIQWMRSWVTAQPGEVVSCVGCHEDQNKIVIPKRVMASMIKPHDIKTPEGGIRSVNFMNTVQPVLDSKCVACHDGSKAGVPNYKDTSYVSVTDWSGTRSFQKSYLAFHPWVNRQGPEADMYVMTPYEYHASTSELVRMLERGHHNVKLTPEEMEEITMWIDLNAPGIGAFKDNKLGQINQYDRRIELANKYANGSGVEWRKEMENYASYLSGKGAITPIVPESEKAPKYKNVSVKGWPMSEAAIKEALAKEPGTRKEIEVAPGVKINFVRIPAGQFVMGANNGYVDQTPAHKAVVKKGFWMAENELTNAQYNALVPDHDSRIYAQFWKDHVTPGYPANEPNQPVIRVSYEQAVKYCEMLSAKTGMKVMLPTETQWEWAARGGSDKDMFFGDRTANFSQYANLADKQLEKMAVEGVNPQPMAHDYPYFETYNYLPKVDTVDDGLMLPSAVTPYKPNQFGLYNILGSIGEWTRSYYLPYPYSDKDQEKAKDAFIVARGGSYIDRPKDATSAVRRHYLPWQPVNNVGLRLIIED